MSEQKMDVFLLALPQLGVERSALVRNLAESFKKDVSSIEKMLRRPRTLVKANVGPELAAKYKALIEKAGGQCELAVHGQALESLQTAAPKIQSLALEPIAAPKVAENESANDNTDSACYCVKCGTVIRIGQTKCPKCFTPVNEFVSKNKTTAGLLALFVGGLGIHRLYLGQWWGIIYLLFWGTLIPSIISLVEAIVFFCTSQESWNEKYGNVQKSSGVMAAVFVVSIVFFIAITGILAAVAIPAYQDYTNRAKIQQAMPVVMDARSKVENFIKKNHSYPNENILVGLPDEISTDVIASISLQDEAKLEVVYRLPLKDKNTIVWSPSEANGKVAWTCTEGTMLDRYRPTECRGGNSSNNSASLTGEVKTNNNSALTQQLYSEDKKISIRVPESWQVKELVPSAAIGAAQIVDDTCVVVFVDSKTDFDANMSVADYAAIVQQQLKTNLKGGELVEKVQSLTIANFPAQQFVFQGSVEGMKIAYLVTVLESDKHFYRILSWTLQSRLDKNKEILQSIAESIHVK
jgi:TM2 domain-containing membrane protein YozV/Tfp pilus assembly protein PilE